VPTAGTGARPMCPHLANGRSHLERVDEDNRRAIATSIDGVLRDGLNTFKSVEPSLETMVMGLALTRKHILAIVRFQPTLTGSRQPAFHPLARIPRHRRPGFAPGGRFFFVKQPSQPGRWLPRRFERGGAENICGPVANDTGFP